MTACRRISAATASPGMQFKAHVRSAASSSPPGRRASRGKGPVLDGRAYAELSKPSSYVKPMTYGAVAPGLFDAIVANKAPPPQQLPHNPPATPSRELSACSAS